MGEIVNLRRARKDKARRSAETRAQANRALHGRTAAERKRETLDAERLVRTLEGARLPGDTDDG